MPFRIFLAFLLSAILCTCGPALDTEEETDAMGFRTEYQVDPETGERQGWERRYNPAGQLISEATYENGLLEGTRTAYYPDGKREIIENYTAGQFNGDYMTFDSLGNLRLRGEYANNIMGKVWTRYWPNGRVREVVTFVDNKENGPFREWYEDGTPKAAGAYQNGGEEQGTLHMFDEDGTLAFVKNCETGLCTTLWRAEDGGQPPVAPPDMTRPADAEVTN